ncbi:LPS-assembly protein LptD [Sphingosinithalassobacter tenebrarum]|uniref:LPS-assembly protein LptD n=1 Tax=Stakelama tenebrarum TaxID=2711215 RepID=A0A6G6YAK0_9SPHN|nr:LPS-assembly protein LptD [Sphingosinithalassobacter tenebrarum]
MASGAHAQDAGRADSDGIETPAPAFDRQPAQGPDLQDRAVDPPPAAQPASQQDAEELAFSAEELSYDYEADIVTASGDVRLRRQSDRLRADSVTWNRKTGEVVAEGNIVVVNAEGDRAYGDRIELTDTLKDGVVENMLVVLEAGGRIAAQRGERTDGIITVQNAAYTPCDVVDTEGCPKEPSWKITADRVVYDPDVGRIRYHGARVSVFGIASLPLPAFSHPVGGRSDDGLLAPEISYNRTNGLQLSVPYFVSFAPDRDLTITPTVFSTVAPMLRADYRELNELGSFRITGYGTYSRRSDDLTVPLTPATSTNDFRGYLDILGNFQLDPHWSVSSSVRLSTDRTFLRRYDISRDDRLRNNLRVQRIDRSSYFAVNGWAVQTLRVGELQGLQPIAFPEIDYRHRFDAPLDSKIEARVNTLALTRTDGQDTQRAFASARWDLRRLTSWGQEITLTAYGRGDVYNANDTIATTVESYRGTEGVQARAVGAVALDMRWPLVGPAFGGTQRITPRFQVVAAPEIKNLAVPNEDARAVDLEDSNLFALNRFPGYDRFEDSTRFTWGVEYALYLPGFSIDANIGQSYRLTSRETLFPDGTGLTDRVSDFVGRTVVRYRDFISFTHRFRIDKDNLAFRRNEVDATVGSRATYVQLGYLRLNRDIGPALEDLQDREEARVGARVQVSRFWSISGSVLVDLTDRNEDLLSNSDGFEPVRHRLGFLYEDNCLRLGVTWKRDYQTTGDARRGNSYLLTFAFTNLGG